MHPPHQSLFRHPSHEPLFLQLVQTSLTLRPIEEVPLQHQGGRFYSRYFLVPKSKRGMRPSLSLPGLNKYIRYMTFHMVTLAYLLPMLNHNDRFAALALQDACVRVVILLGQRKFVVAGHHQYIVVPYGLSLYPDVVTKCMSVVTAYLRKKGIHILPYLDDWFVRDRFQEQVLFHVHFA